MDNSVFERQSPIYHHFFMNAFDYNYWLGCIKMGIYCPKPPKKKQNSPNYEHVRFCWPAHHMMVDNRKF